MVSSALRHPEPRADHSCSDHADGGQEVGGELRARAVKRGFDLTLGGVLAIAAIPVIMVLALGAALSLRAWPFFVHTRVGRAGAPFRMVKIRTLPTSTPRAVSKYALRGVETSRFCACLRRTHLDELPQLLLVPLGSMSLVGPRPEMPELAAAFDPTFAIARTAIRPGCTGLWQISDGAVKLIDEAPEYDLFYLRHCCLRLDLWILWHTTRSCVPGTPRIRCDDVPAYARGHGLLPAGPARRSPALIESSTPLPATVENPQG